MAVPSSNGNFDSLARLTRGYSHKGQQRCKRKWLQIFAAFSSAQVHGARNNKFLMSDLDTLFRDAYTGALCVTCWSPFLRVKEKTARSRTEEESHSSQSTGALMETKDLALSLFRIYLRVVVPIRKGFKAPVQLRESCEEEGHFRFSGRSAWESKRWIESPREQTRSSSSPQGRPCFT